MTDFRGLTIYAVRHGQTEDNVAQIITAQADAPLTALGREQAVAKGVTLKELAGAQLTTLAYFASPLHRACVTMELMRTSAGLPALPYATDPRLMEMSFGAWTGRREGDDRYAPGEPSAHEQWDLQPPGGESLAMVHARVGGFLATLTADCVIVAHARVVQMIHAHYLALSPDEVIRFDPPNAGILRLSTGKDELFGV
ncbi:MAG TPA: histidine phosphatase family protein [Rhizomicrobium sp.]